MSNESPAEIERLLVEQAPDAIIFADRNGIIRIWNASAERVFGHPAEKAIGQSLDILIPESLREAHWRGFDRALEAGETKYKGQALPTKSFTADGRDIYVELSFGILKDASGAVIGATAHARDITERFQQDREMRRELRALREAAKGAAQS
ncbi:MAG: PAS domain S-box protein [Hyphomicrobiales bacterium]